MAKTKENDNRLIGLSIKAVFFDFDDTLVATFEAKKAEHKYIAKTHYNKDLSDEEILKHWGIPYSKMIQIFYETTDVERAIQHNLKNHSKFPKELYKETINTLRHLKNSGKIIGVVTSATSFQFYHDIDMLGVPRELFDYVQTEEDSQFHKPDPKVFDPPLKWLKTKGIKPEEVLYVGDGIRDMEAALGAGLEFLGVTTGLITHEQFKEKGVRSIKGLGELKT